MKTTLTLNDDLATLLNAEARSSGRSFKATVNSLLSWALQARARKKTASEPFVAEALELSLPLAADDLPTRQRRVAQERHPGAYVVFLGERIVRHSPSRQEALRAYREVASESATARPIIVSPDARPKRSPILRGRSLKRARPA
jgi:hypothetical protein